MSELADLLGYTSAPGIARILHINKSHGEGCAGFSARLALFALIVVPLSLGIAEVTIGILQRHASSGCGEPLSLWLVVDGVAALLTAILSIVEVARVHSLARADDEDDSQNARQARAAALGPYAWMGLFIIFLLPLFRLCWLLYALDIIFRIDASSMTNFIAQTLNPGACDPLMFAFIYYYVTVVTILILAILLAFVLLCFALLGLYLRPRCCPPAGGEGAAKYA